MDIEREYRRLIQERHEYADWFRTQEKPLQAADHKDFLDGVLSGLRVHPWLHPEYEPEHDIYRLPFFDPYWDRPGIVYVPAAELTQMNVARLACRTRIATANAYAAGELHKVVNVKRVGNMDMYLARAGR